MSGFFYAQDVRNPENAGAIVQRYCLKKNQRYTRGKIK